MDHFINKIQYIKMKMVVRIFRIINFTSKNYFIYNETFFFFRIVHGSLSIGLASNNFKLQVFLTLIICMGYFLLLRSVSDIDSCVTMSAIMCVGHCCLDYISEVNIYPEEDSDVRSVVNVDVIVVIIRMICVDTF